MRISAIVLSALVLSLAACGKSEPLVVPVVAVAVPQAQPTSACACEPATVEFCEK